ncbi:hypothetical protein [Pseudomonas monteilii]|uniref:hypothetical protein n=1 Tax=Pseudomonas monteilii TaxID=76759 RepID=UPI00137745EA|nr:hypothetical protein [Pseudomonas monteilii]NBB07871.1 hypothetical protein [Pseudomonas monteilii]
MPAFRKRPVVIEAMRYPGLGTSDEILAFEKWLLENGGEGRYDGEYLHIVTLEDGPNGEVKHVADPGDWIIKGVAGEFYPCKPDIFAETYDAA